VTEMLEEPVNFTQ